ncbi:hypothetical protein M2103_000634 [Ereboglobus sp. PH5-5]|nr:hypothetical protein [Ereboglobus sp. PH5-5]
MPSLIAKLKILILAVVLLFAGIATNTAHGSGEWLRLSSEHFDLLSCAPERESKILLIRLEQFRATFFALFPQARTYYKRPYIIVFDSPEQFSAHLPLYKGKSRENVAGIFMESPVSSRIILQNATIFEGLRTVYHEYVHSLVEAMGLRPPLYINEGLAEVFSTFSSRRETVTLGTAPSWHLRALRESKWLPFETVFTVDTNSPYYNETKHARMFYAQSWVFMHYIICGQNTGLMKADRLDVFTNLCETPGVSTADALQQAFGLNQKKLSRTLKSYAGGGRYTVVNRKVPVGSILKQITSKPADSLEHEMELITVKGRTDRAHDAEFQLLQLSERNPKNPRIYELLAEVRAAGNNPAAAHEYWRKAVENNSTNPLAYVWFLRSSREVENSSLKRIMPGFVSTELRKLVDRALELAPDCMEAYELLAMIESQSPEIRVEKINKVLEALSSMRHRSKTYHALAIIYWRLKRYADAEAVIKVMSVDPRTDYKAKRAAREVLREIARETGKPVPAPLPPKI